jgi:hypothetical protein
MSADDPPKAAKKMQGISVARLSGLTVRLIGNGSSSPVKGNKGDDAYTFAIQFVGDDDTASNTVVIPCLTGSAPPLKHTGYKIVSKAAPAGAGVEGHEQVLSMLVDGMGEVVRMREGKRANKKPKHSESMAMLVASLESTGIPTESLKFAVAMLPEAFGATGAPSCSTAFDVKWKSEEDAEGGMRKLVLPEHTDAGNLEHKQAVLGLSFYVWACPGRQKLTVTRRMEWAFIKGPDESQALQVVGGASSSGNTPAAWLDEFAF